MMPKATRGQLIIYIIFCVVFAGLSVTLLNNLLFTWILIFIPAGRPVTVSWITAEIIILLSFYLGWTLRLRQQLVALAMGYTAGVIITLIVIPFSYLQKLTDVFGNYILFGLTLLSIATTWLFVAVRPEREKS